MPVEWSAELVLGWTVIAGIAYLAGEYTDVAARAVGGAKRAKGGPTRKVLGIGGGFLGGLWAGPLVWAFIAGAVGGGAGVIALGGFNLTTVEVAVTGFAGLAVFMIATRRARGD